MQQQTLPETKQSQKQKKEVKNTVAYKVVKRVMPKPAAPASSAPSLNRHERRRQAKLYRMRVARYLARRRASAPTPAFARIVPMTPCYGRGVGLPKHKSVWKPYLNRKEALKMVLERMRELQAAGTFETVETGARNGN